ncbi:MAG: Asp-tRNA(Asn)/Glu-tRNA(Gln) amidotransferase subunit GatB [Rhodospirillaceae bacterium]|nr:Asp-tRNA(Asn)/Glu-tRNA(Gln) amidotransferase subunit GatB [Rhodospirillaceae bacterium]
MQNGMIEGKTGWWEVVMGLEVHAQVLSKSKLFSGAANDFGGEPNNNVSLVDAAMPGMLPVINGYCVEQAIKTGLGLNAEINLRSIFDRKNYFYPDLPAGYQISQYLHPIVGKGHLTIDLPNGQSRIIRIGRLHLEQDAGKSIHDQHPRKTYVDLNRAGIALMEIVSEPDLRTAEEVAAYLKKLRSIMRYLNTCDGNMEQGSMRCDINVSVRHQGQPLGTRCEIKNVNSIRFAQQAIDYEAHRQIGILEDGGKIDQETRLFDANKGVTRTMRSKEHAPDYRYFPDPDLMPLILDPAEVKRIRDSLIELPDAKKQRFMQQYGLSAYDADILVSEQEIAEYYEKLAKVKNRDTKLSANWLSGELFGYLNKIGKTIAQSPITADHLGGLVDLISEGVLSGKMAKEVFVEMTETGKSPQQIVEERGLKQVTDTSAINEVIKTVLQQNADKVAEYKAGKDKLFGFFVGQVMKSSSGKANPSILNELLKKALSS